MILQISNYIEALEYMSVEEQFRQSSLAIIGADAPIKAGTPEYYILARMRLTSMRVLMGFRPKSDQAHGFSTEANALNNSNAVSAYNSSGMNRN